MAMTNTYRYLNQGAPLLISRLSQELARAQNKAPAKQWIAFIKGLTTKGVKATEIEDAGLVSHLETQENTTLTRDELIGWLRNNTPTIKEIDLGKPSYSGYHHAIRQGEVYQETLYVLNSQRDNIEDRLEEIRFDLEELDFDLERLAADPMAAVRLHTEQVRLKTELKRASVHSFGHFAQVVDEQTGEQAKNIMAHARVSVRGPLYFIEEIQSDWAQRGRRSNWKGIPRGPWVTNTELWSGLVLRRQLQRAAENPAITQVAWITAGLRNGWDNRGEASDDGLDDFYLKILPKLADKVLSGTGEKVKMATIELADKTVEVPALSITDAVRAKLRQAQPLYSRDMLQAAEPQRMLSRYDYAAYQRQLQHTQEMLGSSVSVRLAAHVLDAATGDEVAGRQLGKLLEVSLQARNPARALAHETWHYAALNLLDTQDQDAVHRAFADGTRLNRLVRTALVREQANTATLLQCDDPAEAAAHGFSLWLEGKLTLTADEARRHEAADHDGIDRTVGRIFRKVEQAFAGLTQWVRRIVVETPAQQDERRVVSLFQALRAGHLQEVQALEEEEDQTSHRPAMRHFA